MSVEKPIDVKEAVDKAVSFFRELQIAKVTDVLLEGVEVPGTVKGRSPNWRITIGYQVVAPEFLGVTSKAVGLPKRCVVSVGPSGEFKGMSPA